jgi:NADH-quinone oxidoreductase subunit K
MNEISVNAFWLVSAFIFSIGLGIILLKRNTLFILMGIELILAAANLNFAAFNRGDQEQQGLIFSLFILVIGVCEISIALAIIIMVYRNGKLKVESGKV